MVFECVQPLIPANCLTVQDIEWLTIFWVWLKVYSITQSKHTIKHYMKQLFKKKWIHCFFLCVCRYYPPTFDLNKRYSMVKSKKEENWKQQKKNIKKTIEGDQPEACSLQMESRWSRPGVRPPQEHKKGNTITTRTQYSTTYSLRLTIRQHCTV